MAGAQKAAKTIGVSNACKALAVPRSSFYRFAFPVHGPWPKRFSPRALSEPERHQVLALLHEERFVDKAPAEIYATLLDEERYYCSPRTMYRILSANSEVRERRNQLSHPSYAAPELLATKQNTLWSWDITKLKGPAKWSYFYLYVIIDVFSRYVVGWMLADRESSALAKELISNTCKRQNIKKDELTLHADRGSSMKSKPVALLLADLGVTKTHSRPYVSDDNPYSEAQFKTLKYRPDFPDRFGCIQNARSFMKPFFHWYNEEHRHSGIGMMTPADVHFGFAEQRQEQRTEVLLAAHRAHPERFVHGKPKPFELPTAVWINKPKSPEVNQSQVVDVALLSSVRVSTELSCPPQAEPRRSDIPKSVACGTVPRDIAELNRTAAMATQEVVPLH
jgi:putative transposase